MKRAGSAYSTAGAIDRWVRAIAARGVRTVVAAEGFGDNPRVLADGRAWVVYPFVPGTPYVGALAQIHDAGALLGHMHVACAFNDHGLDTTPRLAGRSWDWIARHMAASAVSMRREGIDCAAFGYRVAARWDRGAAPNSLPMAGASVDFKAANIVFAARPVLIDPDHAAFVPRLYDLAVAALLFHHETVTAPARLWNLDEWRAFLSGYRNTVPMDRDEIQAWPDVLRVAWLEQGLWLLGSAGAAWSDPRERRFLRSLAEMVPEMLPLDT